MILQRSSVFMKSDPRRMWYFCSCSNNSKPVGLPLPYKI